MSSAAQAVGTRSLVAFRAAGQDLCTDIASVREIRSWTPATPLPHTPHYVRGVVNLRGEVLPILDLADRLGLPSPEPDPRHVILIVMAGDNVQGLVVEGVSEIMEAPADSIHPAPDYDCGSHFVRAVVLRDERLYRMLDMADVLPPMSVTRP